MHPLANIEYRGQLKAARTLLGLTQKEVAQEVGISIVTMRRIESETGYAEQVAVSAIQRVRIILENHGAVFLKSGDTSPGLGIALRE